jgi:glyoxylase-like metal-dependent hydrolase (beta-lactamase superfamily II)
MSDPNRLNVMIVPVTPFQQNCSLIWNEITKSGVVIDPGGDLDLIRQAIAKAGVRIERILLTHGHIDHAGGAADLRTELDVPLEGPHVADRFLLDNLAETAAAYGLSGARDVTPDRWLQEGEQVTIGGVPFDILHCPGHSPGSVAFVNRDLKFAVVGDVLFQGSIGRSDDVAFICGHGPASTMGEERRSNPFLR